MTASHSNSGHEVGDRCLELPHCRRRAGMDLDNGGIVGISFAAARHAQLG
jgi:hypothetical protein